MDFDNLNKMVKFIEDNLTNKIEYKNLARIVGISEQSLQKVFSFLTGISISQYIRKRRLSRALEDLRNSNQRVLDIAIKYQYESEISFTRAFKEMFGFTPIEVKKDKNISYKIMPVMVLENSLTQKELSYTIEDIEELELYCFKVEDLDFDDYLYKIRKLYKTLKEKGIHEKIDKEGMYGISLMEDEKYVYMLGSKKEIEDTTKYILPAGKYAKFEVGSREQKDIVNLENNIYLSWDKSSNLSLDYDFEFEYYEDNNCYLFMKLI